MGRFFLPGPQSRPQPPYRVIFLMVAYNFILSLAFSNTSLLVWLSKDLRLRYQEPLSAASKLFLMRIMSVRNSYSLPLDLLLSTAGITVLTIVNISPL